MFVPEVAVTAEAPAPTVPAGPTPMVFAEPSAPLAEQQTVDLTGSHLVPRPPGARPLPVPRGRHSHPDDDEETEETDVLPSATATSALAEPAAEPMSAPTSAQTPTPAPTLAPTPASTATPARARREGGTAADWRLLRTDSALRNRVIAAALVPFVLYAVVLVVIGRTDTFAVWVWLPLITAGIGSGLLLDAAHARARKAERVGAASPES